MRRQWNSVYSLVVAAALAGPQPVTGADGKAEFEAWKKTVKNPAVFVKEVSEAPKLDGRIDPVCEKNAEPMKLSFLDGFKGTPEERTVGYIVSHKGSLYITVRCNKKNPERIANKTKKHDGGVWADESVEIFLDPNKTRDFNYYHLIVNSDEVSYDAKTHDYRKRNDKSWDPKTKIACQTDREGWTMELCIPISEFGVAEGKVNRIWSFNINRSSPDPDDPAISEDTAWSPTKSRTNHLPSMFGYIWLDAGNVLNK